jgi:hypothetical protein
MFTSRGGGLGAGPANRAGGRGGLGSEPGPTKLPTKSLEKCKICIFFLVIKPKIIIKKKRGGGGG